MITVEIVGGLGNQMFQYAFYYSLKKHYGDEYLALYTGRFKSTSDNQGFELQNIFGVDEHQRQEQDIVNLIDDANNLFSKLRRKVIGTRKTFFLEQAFRYNSRVFEQDKSKETYFRGLWQDENYFIQYRNDLLNAFKFNLELNERNKEVLNRVLNSNSVSIHIRRGDYISNPKYKNILGDICGYEYYRNAFEQIKLKSPDCEFFVFSDDINWVRNEFDFLNNQKVSYIDFNSGLDSYRDMQLMSNCKHNIIANSSFSWWGAWLNNNPLKVVIAPDKWFKNNPRLENNHIVPDSWIKVKTA